MTDGVLHPSTKPLPSYIGGIHHNGRRTEQNLPCDSYEKSNCVFLGIVLLASVSALAQSPDVFKRKQIETRMLAAARWQLANPKHELFDWTNGAFYAGVFAAYETTKSKELWDARVEMGEKNKWGPGKRFDHADDIVINQGAGAYLLAGSEVVKLKM